MLHRNGRIAGAALLALALGCNRPPVALTQPAPAPPEKEKTVNRQLATFGAGCFWGVEARFRQVRGVTDAAVGYMGGGVENPTYKQVCTDATGHAEVVQVEFDPEVVDYLDLVDVFFNCHDPTQFNRQGPDYGSQYRSVIFTHTPEQREVAETALRRMQESGRYSKKIVTQIAEAGPFWRAEDYHQNYLAKRGIESCGTGGG